MLAKKKLGKALYTSLAAVALLGAGAAVGMTVCGGSTQAVSAAATPKENADGMYVANDGWYFYDAETCLAYQKNKHDEDALNQRSGHITVTVKDTTGRLLSTIDDSGELYQSPDYAFADVTVPFGYKVSSLTKGFKFDSEQSEITGSLAKPNTDIVLTLAKDTSHLKTKTTDKTALAAAIDKSYNYEATQYTYTSYNNLIDVRDDIQLNADALTSQFVIDKQTSDLNVAINGLVKRSQSSVAVDKSKLKDAIARADNAIDYRTVDPVSADDLGWKISTADALMDDAHATQSEIDTVISQIDTGIKNLRKYDAKHAYGETEVTLDIGGDTYKHYVVKGVAGQTYDVTKDLPAGYKVSGKSTFKFTDWSKNVGTGDGAGQLYYNSAEFKLVPSSTTTKNDQGPAINYKKYVTVTRKGYTVWGDFGWSKKKTTTTSLYNKTYLAKVKYNHSNGSTYLSLYDGSKWLGYVNASATKVSAKQQGPAISANKYVTITSKNYTIWSGFDFKTVKHYSKNYLNKTYHVKTIYNHASGAVYYSLYDSKGKWFGYINAAGTKVAKGAQGVAIAYNKTVTVKKSGYTIWGDFFTKKRGTTTKYKGKKLTAKVAYNHANGSQYLSLYSGSKWVGYVNASVTK